VAFPGRLLALLTGGAAARAVSSALDPTIEDVRQDAWRANPIRQLDLGTLAAAVAQELATEGGVAPNAEAIGYSGDKVAMAAEVARAAPPVAELLRMLLRGKISEAEARKGLKKHAIPDEWHSALLELEFLRLTPADLGNARQQGFEDTISLDEEAREIGLTADRLKLLFELSGLPPGIVEGLQMLRRSIIDEAQFAEIVRTGHTKTKWTGQLLALKRQILSPSIYVTAYLKGWISKGARDAGGLLSGYSAEDMELWYLSGGRPASPTQVATANARNIPGPDGLTGEALMQKAVAESDIRPEWGPMIYGATRYVYPPLFQLNRLVTAGTVEPDLALTWLGFERYAPDVIEAFRKAWTGPTGTATDKHVTTAQGQLFSATHKAFVTGGTGASNAEAAMAQIGIPADAQSSILGLWTTEKDLQSKRLSQAQIKRAWKAGEISEAQALSRLEALGYSAADAALYLHE
jgi:hypothetical protein